MTSTLTYGYDVNGSLTNIVSSDPNGVDVGYEYDALNRLHEWMSNHLMTYDVRVTDLRTGAVVRGPSAVTERVQTTVTILDRNNQRHVLARDGIKELTPSAVSLMPEGLLEALTPQQVMDLFAYLQGDGQAATAATGK